MKFPKELVESGDHDAIEDVTPDEQEKLANEPASKAWVIALCAKCWVKRWVRKVRTTWATILVIMGLLIIGNAFIVRAVVESVVRSTVLSVLREHKIISAEPSPAPGESVATLIGGSR